MNEEQNEEKVDRLEADEIGWRQFVTEMYGCMADAPIERGAEGPLELRLAFDDEAGQSRRPDPRRTTPG